MVATSQRLAVRTNLPRMTIVAASAFVLAGALRLTTAVEQIGLDVGFAVFFLAVAVAQLGFGALLSVGARRVMTVPVQVATMVVTLGLVALWFAATTAVVPRYPLLNGPYPVDVLDLGSAILETTAVVALCRALPARTRRRVVWSLVGLVSAAWLVWVVIITVAGLSD
jgi:hypothetical protein